MAAGRGTWLERAGGRAGGVELSADHMPEGVLRIRVSTRVTRLNGMEACAWLAGSLLVDSGFAHVGGEMQGFLRGRSVDAVCLTHHHEDHAGGAGRIAAAHGCPVHLRAAGRRFEEGLAALPPYRLLWWGTPDRVDPVEMPDRIAGSGRVLRAVPIPGHSATHTAMFEERTGIVFVGDLYVTGGATGVMAHEDPWQSIASLRAVAALDPSWMFTGHGLAMQAPAPALRDKADRIEQAAQQAVALHERGIPVAAIVRRLFARHRLRDRWIATFTGGEFSRANFVRACVRHAA